MKYRGERERSREKRERERERMAERGRETRQDKDITYFSQFAQLYTA